MNNCRASLDLVVFHGVPPEKLRAARDLQLIAGDWGEFEQRAATRRSSAGRWRGAAA